MKTKLDMCDIATSKIIANRNNPRSEIGDTSDLEASIKAHGLIQPITVRKIEEGKDSGKWEVVAGSRRLQACKNIGVEFVSCNVIDGPEQEMFEIATAENIARRQMTPSDECKAVQKMITDGADIHTVAANFGRCARWVIGRMKMAELGDEILQKLDAGELTLGHAEVLTMCDSNEEISRYVSDCKYSSPEEIKKLILSEKSNLSKAPFDVKKICKGCKKQTISQQDIFGDITDSYCQDGKCYQKHVEELIERKRKECLDLGMIEVSGTDYNWSFSYCGKTDWIDVNCEHTEDEEETIKLIKANGKHPYFNINENAVVTARWRKADSINHDEDDDDDESVEAQNDWKRKDGIRQILIQKEKEIVTKKVEEILCNIPNEVAALILSTLSNYTYDFTEMDDNGNEMDVEDSPLNHIDEEYTDHKHEFGLSWIQLLHEEIIGCVLGYNGVSKNECEYFGIDHDKIVEEATKEYEESNQE